VDSSNASQMIKDFLDRFDSPKEHPEVLKALGLSKRLGELFWAALAMVPEGGIDIIGLSKFANRHQFSSSSVSNLMNRKLLEKGPSWGVWLISQNAINKMATILNGNTVPQEKGAIAVTGRPKNKKAALKKALIKRSRGKTKLANLKTQKMIESLKEELARYDNIIAMLERDIEKRRDEKNALLRSIALLVKDANNI
jgi:hypothetical protein